MVEFHLREHRLQYRNSSRDMKGLPRNSSIARCFGILFGLLALTTLFLYYSGYNGFSSNTHYSLLLSATTSAIGANSSGAQRNHETASQKSTNDEPKNSGYQSDGPSYSVPFINSNTCPAIKYASTDINTADQFQKFEFQPYWIKNREFWDESFEERYKKGKMKPHQFPLKVIVVPHSHNDPGWLKTFEGYYHTQTRNVLNNMVDKLVSLPNMTFIWSEISFLAQWWESAHPTRKKIVEKLVRQGKLEIVTGGWVMTDEATTHIYAMLDQLIEGSDPCDKAFNLNVCIKKTGPNVYTLM